MPSVNPNESFALSRKMYVAKPNTGAKAVDAKASVYLLVMSFGWFIKLVFLLDAPKYLHITAEKITRTRCRRDAWISANLRFWTRDDTISANPVDFMAFIAPSTFAVAARRSSIASSHGVWALPAAFARGNPTSRQTGKDLVFCT